MSRHNDKTNGNKRAASNNNASGNNTTSSGGMLYEDLLRAREATRASESREKEERHKRRRLEEDMKKVEQQIADDQKKSGEVATEMLALRGVRDELLHSQRRDREDHQVKVAALEKAINKLESDKSVIVEKLSLSRASEKEGKKKVDSLSSQCRFLDDGYRKVVGQLATCEAAGRRLYGLAEPSFDNMSQGEEYRRAFGIQDIHGFPEEGNENLDPFADVQRTDGDDSLASTTSPTKHDEEAH